MNKQEIDIKRRVVSDLEKKFHKKHEFLSSQYHRNALLSLSFQLLDIKFFAINMLHVILFVVGCSSTFRAYFAHISKIIRQKFQEKNENEIVSDENEKRQVQRKLCFTHQCSNRSFIENNCGKKLKHEKSK